jgi:hypothetical protein
MKTRIAADGCWLTHNPQRPIGEWEWFLRVDCPDYVDVENAYADVPNAEKEAAEAEQETWREAQNDTPEEQAQ